MQNKEEESYVDDFFQVNRCILKCAGLWRPSRRNKYTQAVYQFYVIIVVLFVNVWFTFTEFVSLFFTYKDEYALIKNVNFFLTHFMGAVKVGFWYFKSSCMRTIINRLEDPYFHYDSCSSFHPGTIWKQYKLIGIKYSILFLGLAHATLISSYIPAISAAVKHIRYNGENTTSALPKTLPYYSWMPFKYDTGYTYLLAILYQGGPMFSYAYSIVGMDSLFMNLMNCVTANVQIIQGAFYTIRERCENRLAKNKFHINKLRESTNMMMEMDSQMEKIIKHLQTTFKYLKRTSRYQIRCCHELETMYTLVTLCQVTATLFILCTCLYLVSMAPLFSKQFLAECVYMAAMFFQLYLYCSFGNEVTLKIIKTSYSIFALIKNTSI